MRKKIFDRGKEVLATGWAGGGGRGGGVYMHVYMCELCWGVGESNLNTPIKVDAVSFSIASGICNSLCKTINSAVVCEDAFLIE